MTFSKFCLYFAEFFVFFFAGKHSHLCFPGNSDFAKEEKANPGRAFILFWECREQAVTQQSFPIHQSDSFSQIQLIRGRSIRLIHPFFQNIIRMLHFSTPYEYFWNDRPVHSADAQIKRRKTPLPQRYTVSTVL